MKKIGNVGKIRFNKETVRALSGQELGGAAGGVGGGGTSRCEESTQCPSFSSCTSGYCCSAPSNCGSVVCPVGL